MKSAAGKVLAGVFLPLLLVFLANCSIFDKGKKPTFTKEEYLRRGKAFLKDGKHKEAWIEFRNAELVDPKDAEVHFQLAQAYGKLNDIGSAFRELQQAVDLDPKNLTAQLMLGNYYLVAAGNDRTYFERALSVADLILNKDPNNLEALILRGNAHAGLNNYEKAVEELQQVLEKDPNRIPVYINLATFHTTQKDLDAAEEVFKQALRLNETSLEANIAAANFYLLRRKNPDEAEKYLRKVFELYPKDSRTGFTLAMFYLLRKKPAQAEAVLLEAVKLDPNRPEPKRTLASFYVANGQADKGKQILQDLIKKNPDDTQSRNRLARLLLDDKNLVEARLHIEYVLKKDNNDGEAQALKGRYLLQEGKTDDAIQALNTARELNPSSAYTNYLLGFAHFNKGDTAQAETSFSEALKFDRHMFVANIGLAKTYLINKQYDTALAEAAKVLQVQPNNVEALLTKGEVLLLTDRLPEAREQYLHVIGVDPRNPAGHHRLGMVHYRQKQYDKALAKFEEAMAINADLVDAMNDILAALTAQKKDSQALARVTKQINLAANKAPFYELQGKLHFRGQRYAEAETSFRKALEIDKNLFSSYFLLSQLLVRNNKSAQPAIAPLDAALKVNPSLPYAYVLKGLVFDHYRDFENAKISYKKALDMSPDLALAANNLAVIYSESGRSDELDLAQFLAQKARRAAPNSEAVADTLGWIYYKRTNYPMAIDNLEFCVTKDPSNPIFRYHLGMAYFKMERRVEAKKALQIAVGLGDKSKFDGLEEARQALRALP
ncbi:MAG: tetratricopeptide repeat protein [Acidobacteria bacterium]|nr:tetratricopeptide repeat protein [Acidobacteriota bacterium]MBI3656113.1 tetratricopeptide repeat protein [Acidobacteriota bacterium]